MNCSFCGEEVREEWEDLLSHDYDSGTHCSSDCFIETNPECTHAFVIDLTQENFTEDDWGLVVRDF